MLDPDHLLAGPRGRRLCLEFVLALAREAATPLAEELLRAVFFAAHQLDPGCGVSRVMLSASGEEPSPAMPSFTPEDVAELVGVLPLTDIDDCLLMDALTAAVDSAQYWQEPDGEDVVAAEPSVQASLTRIAASIASSDAAAWWVEPLSRTAQYSVAFQDGDSPASTLPGTATEHLERWRSETVTSETRARRDRPPDPHANWSGEWWSTPPRHLTRTTRSRGTEGALGLRLVEDAHGWDRAFVHPVDVPDTLNVYEVDGPQAWARLCGRFPLEVTASRRHDWFRTTGAAGRWVIPDWSQAAEEFDAIHLTVAGYLATAGRAVAVTEDTASVLAGWDPDQTYWLTDVVLASAPERTWIRDDDTWTEQTH
ncbi:hypothetical protein [Nocardioides mangrovi]|uniref:Uncharacterized protein n=1 Tax=Nocardioides mangrovi TaxID=2874580 RepID=A0ABS7UCV1_9ACTN|nr:hypothetical protein [Nocardioides mangrovi]MBZ5738829.1 hypothetical protein [Nocardioides mangrovi]